MNGIDEIPNTDPTPSDEERRKQIVEEIRRKADKLESLQAQVKSSARPDPQEKFEQWCIVELFGHQRIAGKVTEQVIGGQGFVRVDVPEVIYPAHDKQDVTIKPAYTKFYGAGAIYAMSPVDEETCIKALRSMYQPPVEAYHFRDQLPALARPTLSDDDERDDWRVGA